MNTLPRLSLPPFSSTILTSNEKFMSTHRKHIPKESSTIFGKILSMYYEEENGTDGHFVKCNYLEELVERDKLNYITVKVFPSSVMCSVKDQDKSFEFKREDEICTSINNEEVPIQFFDLWEKKHFMYEYHVILQVQMFASDDQRKDPLFTTFVLLRPTYHSFNILKKNLEECNERITLVKKPDESEILFNMTPPLYLGTDQAVLKFICLEEFYRNPFESTSSNMRFTCSGAPFQDEKENSPLQGKNENIPFQVKKENIQDKSEKPKLFFHTDLKADLLSLLESRQIYIGEKYTKDNNSQEETLTTTGQNEINPSADEKERGIRKKYFKDRSDYNQVEVFTFEHKLRIGKGIYQLQKDEIAVYVKDNIFYTFLKKCDSVIDPNEERDWFVVSTRKNLDLYILTFATVVSEKFCKEMHIKYKNHCDNQERLFFFCMDMYQEKDEEKDSLEERDKLTAHTTLSKPEAEQSSMETDSKKEEEESFERLKKLKTYFKPKVEQSSKELYYHKDSHMEVSEIGDESVTPEFQGHSNEQANEQEERCTQCLSVDNNKTESICAQNISFSKEDLWSYGLFSYNKSDSSEQKGEETKTEDKE